MDDYINLIKLCVGCETLEELIERQNMASSKNSDGLPRHITRMWPKKEVLLVNGGSIYWVIKRFIQCRQKILKLNEEIGDDNIRRCCIVLDKEITKTSWAPKRPFQGWRYLKKEDAPIDIKDVSDSAGKLPSKMAEALADIGVI